MFFFQSPLAEIALPVDDWVFLDRLWADWSPGYDAAVDVAHVKDAIATPERIEAAIGYYAPSSTRAATIRAGGRAGGHHRHAVGAGPLPPRR